PHAPAVAPRHPRAPARVPGVDRGQRSPQTLERRTARRPERAAAPIARAPCRLAASREPHRRRVAPRREPGGGGVRGGVHVVDLLGAPPPRGPGRALPEPDLPALHRDAPRAGGEGAAGAVAPGVPAARGARAV